MPSALIAALNRKATDTFSANIGTGRRGWFPPKESGSKTRIVHVMVTGMTAEDAKFEWGPKDSRKSVDCLEVTMHYTLLAESDPESHDAPRSFTGEPMQIVLDTDSLPAIKKGKDGKGEGNQKQRAEIMIERLLGFALTIVGQKPASVGDAITLLDGALKAAEIANTVVAVELRIDYNDKGYMEAEFARSRLS